MFPMRAVCSYREQGFPKKQKNTFLLYRTSKKTYLHHCNYLFQSYSVSNHFFNFFVTKMSILDLKLSFEIWDAFFHYLNFNPLVPAIPKLGFSVKFSYFLRILEQIEIQRLFDIYGARNFSLIIRTKIRKSETSVADWSKS